MNLLIFLFITETFIANLISCQELYAKNVDFNSHQFWRHRTEKFYMYSSNYSDVIIRRSDFLEISVDLNNETVVDSLKIKMIFKTQRDEMVIDLPSSNPKNKWRLEQSKVGNKINVKIHIPAEAPIGVWNMTILLVDRNKQVIEEIEIPNRIIVLFNPWSIEDDAYFPEQHKLDEYVLNERGYTYGYNFKDWYARPWIFGQFQENVLNALLMVMSTSNLKAADRGDILLLSREITYLLSDFEGRHAGILRGRWEEPYEPIDGRPVTKPWAWTGSTGIYQQYYENGGKPVGYGQCWVFAGILATAYRALGIAARPVTNLVSGADEDRDLTIDIYLDENGNIKKQDFVWNFHVWVEAWYNKRRDMGDEYSGWQELDAVGLRAIGPASTVAVRKSELRRFHYTQFIYEGMNSDEVTWSANGEILHIDTAKIGLGILTKKYGSNEAEFITELYKPPENTTAERDSYRAAAKSLRINPPSLRNAISSRALKKQVTVDIVTPRQALIGSSVPIEVYIRNPSLNTKNFNVYIRATAMYYTGKDAATIKLNSSIITLQGSKRKLIQFNIKPEEYIGKIRDEHTIRIEVAVKRDKIVAYKKKMLSLREPELKIIGPKVVNINQTYSVNIQLKNPFRQTLSNCYIAVEGIGIRRRIYRIKNIAPSALGTASIQLKSAIAGKEFLVMQFISSSSLKLQASTEFKVRGKPSYSFAKYVIQQRAQQSQQRGPNGIVQKISKQQFACCNVVKM